MKKILKLKKRFSKLRGVKSPLRFQKLRDDLVLYKFKFLNEHYIPAENRVDSAQHKFDFARLKIKAAITEERASGIVIKNIREETDRRTELYAEELRDAKAKFNKLKPIYKFIESMENSIASHLR